MINGVHLLLYSNDSRSTGPRSISVQAGFTRPAVVAPSTLRDALLWKCGHLGKPSIPPDHERLIAQLQIHWSAVAVNLPNDPEAVLYRPQV